MHFILSRSVAEEAQHAMATSEVATCSWSRQDSYASTTASSEPVDDIGGSDEHPAFAMLSGDEHPAAHALQDGDWQAAQADLVHCAIDVLQRSLAAASAGREWRALVDFELLPLGEQCTAVHEAMASLSSGSGRSEHMKRHNYNIYI